MAANDFITLPPIAILATAAHALATAATETGDTANASALNKAAMQLHQGMNITPTVGGFLVASATRAGTVHRVSTVQGCSCEAGQNGRPCWHAAAVEIIIDAQSRAIPAAKPRVRITREQIDAGRAHKLQKRITLARSIAEMDEVFAR